MKNNLLDNLIFAVVGITLVLIAVFSKNPIAMLFIASGGLMLYGILASIQKNRYGVLSLGCGISLLITMILYLNKFLDKGDSVTFMITCSMTVIIAVGYIFMFINEKAKFSKYSLVVEGTVVDLEKNPNTKKEYYSPLYQYTVKNKDYYVSLPYYIDKNIPNMGDKCKFYVDPNDVLDVYFDKTLLNKIKYWFSGLILMIISIVIMISLFM